MERREFLATLAAMIPLVALNTNEPVPLKKVQSPAKIGEPCPFRCTVCEFSNEENKNPRLEKDKMEELYSLLSW